MLNKIIFIGAHQLIERKFYPTYRKLVRTQWHPYRELKNSQEKDLRKIISFSYENVPYYRNLFDHLKLNPDSIKRIEDLEKIPILTKETIKQNWDQFKPVNLNSMKFYDRRTGGSTGTPFKYRLSKFDRFLGGALWYRGWGYAGYELGDKVVFLGGASLDIGTKSNFVKLIHENIRNIRMLSSFDMSDSDMKSYSNTINNFKPKYIYGYASSLYFFSKWLDDSEIDVHSPKAIFSTAEKLFPEMRKKIENVFDTDVYDTYGLNDGGVSAYECPEHSGLHIDTERSVMEVVDAHGHQLDDGEGRILATSLHNYAMPFIRYDTGDIGHIIPDTCGCGRGYRLLKEITGRQQEMLLTPEGKYVHGEFFTHIFWEISGVKEFQVVQDSPERIIIKIIPEDGFDERETNKIKSYIKRRSEGWNVEFRLVDEIERTSAGKYKFVINEMVR